MAKPRSVRLRVDLVDGVIGSLDRILATPDLDNRKRPKLGRLRKRLVGLRRRSRRGWVQLPMADLNRVLRCLAELGDWPSDLWRRHFGDE